MSEKEQAESHEDRPPPGHAQRPYMVDDLMSFHYLPSEEVFTSGFTVPAAMDFPERILQLCTKHKPVSE